jgi:NAD(P)-dependent dehydrogenase (short-subunit alcohol dehydrogenase family)
MTMTHKHSLIIGGSKGTGRAVAMLFSEKNHKVSVISRSLPENPVTDVNYVQADLEKDDLNPKLDEIVSKNGPIDNLVFCQRYRGKDNDWQGEFEVSVNATKNIIEYFSNNFNAKSGSIVLISSVASKFVLYQPPLSYHVAKASMEKMAEYYAVNLAPKGIRVNAVLPGTILKDENKEFYKSKPDLMKLYADNIPMGRMISSQEIANVVDFLCSDNASAVTGQKIAVDGGMSLIGQESFMLKKLS